MSPRIFCNLNRPKACKFHEAFKLLANDLESDLWEQKIVLIVGILCTYKMTWI